MLHNEKKAKLAQIPYGKHWPDMIVVFMSSRQQSIIFSLARK